MEAAITSHGRLTILFLAILASDHVHAQSSDELLREFSASERASIQSACYGAGLSGPARFYACVARKADELRRSPGEPSLAEFSIAEQASLRSACYGAGLSGPARFYACLRQKADELRNVRRRLGLSSQATSPEISEKTRRVAKPTDAVAASPAPSVQAPAGSALAQAIPTSPTSASIPLQPRAPATPAIPPPWMENQRVSERVASAAAPKPITPARGATTITPSGNHIKSIVPVPPESTAPAPAPRASQPSSSARRTARQRKDETALVVAFWLMVGAWIWGVRYFRRSQPAPTPPAGTPPAAAPPRPDDTYRQRRAYAGRGGITFADPRTDTLWNPDEADLTDVRDAITGQPLRPASGLHRCTRCHVFYQTSSVELLNRENGGCCVACGSASVSPVNGARAADQQADDHRSAITTLANYRSRVGEVVVFEGRCVRVLPSRSGTAFAVMFEDRAWTEGFKLVIRTGFVEHLGGAGFIRSLAGRTIRARGLIVHSPVFGYEITVTTRSMILGVWS